MYVPKHNQIEDRAALLAYMRAYSFAALTTAGAGGLMATHLPFVIEEASGQTTLLAHMARANPQWRDFADGPDALVIFMQPHAYVSPRLYDGRQNVPTWNYVAVHAYGRPQLIEERADKIELQKKLIRQHDAGYLTQLAELPDSYIDARLAAIVSFSLAVTRIDARYKLSQDKNPAERERIARELEAGEDSVAADTARLMRKHS
ncbi:MAG: FMN-binding negative transcriptional regulator [Betaproteobacteria bacterium]|nr:MAG: FMN-binding negative transcriptional regulator [Betaproteobacteria bacterium]